MSGQTLDLAIEIVRTRMSEVDGEIVRPLVTRRYRLDADPAKPEPFVMIGGGDLDHVRLTAGEWVRFRPTCDATLGFVFEVRVQRGEPMVGPSRGRLEGRPSGVAEATAEMVARTMQAPGLPSVVQAYAMSRAAGTHATEEEARLWGCSHEPACATPEACGVRGASTAQRGPWQPGAEHSFVWPATETQATIAAWADATFGPSASNARIAARANEEMAELLRALTADDASPKAPAEIADVVIVLARLAERMGADLAAEVQKKMAINRTRRWARDATGHGYHVRPRRSWRESDLAAEQACTCDADPGHPVQPPCPVHG